MTVQLTEENLAGMLKWDEREIMADCNRSSFFHNGSMVRALTDNLRYHTKQSTAKDAPENTNVGRMSRLFTEVLFDNLAESLADNESFRKLRKTAQNILDINLNHQVVVEDHSDDGMVRLLMTLLPLGVYACLFESDPRIKVMTVTLRYRMKSTPDRNRRMTPEAYGRIISDYQVMDRLDRLEKELEDMMVRHQTSNAIARMKALHAVIG